MPAIPANPSPPPLWPRAVALATLASASVNVIPSAPLVALLDPMNMSKAAEMPPLAKGVGQKAEPACQVVAGVSCRFAGDAERLSTEEPFSCHPPATGEGIVPGGGPAPYMN